MELAVVQSLSHSLSDSGYLVSLCNVKSNCGCVHIMRVCMVLVVRLYVHCIYIYTGISLQLVSLAQPNPLPNATLRRGSGDIAIKRLLPFTNILVKTAGIH